MKLYRIVVITPVKNIERGVWAKEVDIEKDHIIFVDDELGDGDCPPANNPRVEFEHPEE